MQLYDEIILRLNELVSQYSDKTRVLAQTSTWPDIGKHNMVLRSEMAYELGGSEQVLAAIGGTCVTSDENLVEKDEILLIGPDLTEITQDLPYARISLCRVTKDSMGEGNILYKSIKNIEYARYHVSPEGFMVRASSIQNRESVRVSKKAIEDGISFSDAGSLLLKAFHKDSRVQAAKVIFISEKDFPFSELADLMKKSDMITKTIDHIVSSSMDCNTCGLQKVCEEVEGMKELHFKKDAEKA